MCGSRSARGHSRPGRRLPLRSPSARTARCAASAWRSRCGTGMLASMASGAAWSRPSVRACGARCSRIEPTPWGISRMRWAYHPAVDVARKHHGWAGGRSFHRTGRVHAPFTVPAIAHDRRSVRSNRHPRGQAFLRARRCHHTPKFSLDDDRGRDGREEAHRADGVRERARVGYLLGGDLPASRAAGSVHGRRGQPVHQRPAEPEQEVVGPSLTPTAVITGGSVSSKRRWRRSRHRRGCGRPGCR